MTIDDFIGNLKTYKQKKFHDRQMAEPHKEKNLVLKAAEKLKTHDDIALLTCRLQKMIRKNRFKNKSSNSKAKVLEKSYTDEYYKCGIYDHIIRNCPIWKTEQKKNNLDKVKEKKENRVHEKRLTKNKEYKIVKRALPAMRNTSSDDIDDDSDNEYQSLIAEDDSDLDNKDIFALIANSDSNIEYGQTEINFYDIKKFILILK